MKSKLFKRILSLTTAVFMVLTMLPATAFAVDVSTDVEDLENTQTSSAQVVCPCAKCGGQVPEEGWTALSVTEGTLTEGHYYVPLPAEDETTYQLTNYIEIKNASVVIDLRGNTITAEAASQSFRIGDNGSLTILDSSEEETGVVYGAEAATGVYGGNIYLEAASGTTAVFNLYSGTIANGTSGVSGGADGQGGNIRLSARCTVNLYGGEVTGGQTNYRAGNISVSAGTLNMYNDAKVTNGSIIDIEKGTTGNYGGNIYATSGGKINIYDNAVVSGGRANQGGNICAFSNVIFNMYGGAIYGGSAIKYNNDTEGTVADATYNGPDVYAAGGSATSYAKVNLYGGDLGQYYQGYSCLTAYNGTLSANPTNYLAPCAAAFKTVDETGATRYAVYQTALSDTGACEAGTACGHTYVRTPASTVNSKTTHLAVRMEQCKFCQKVVAWAPMFNDNIALNHVYMADDIALREQLALADGDALCMDMNGYDLTCAMGHTRGITTNKATLNITNTSATGSEIRANGGGVMSITGGAVYLHNITVTGGTVTGNGGNINIGSSGEITLEDCTVTDGTSTNNGGNICSYASDLTIKGDTKITGGTATGNGGNIYLGTTSNMYMYSGEVSGGTGASGEDICFLPSTGSFYLYDGTIGPEAVSGNSLMLYNYEYTKSDGSLGSYNASFYMYGGTVDSIGVGGKDSQPASGTIAIYAGTVGNDPTTANNKSTTMVAPCSTSTANEDGTYTVAHADTLTQVDAQAPTCTEVGWEAYQTCETCGYNSYVEIPATGHTLEWVAPQAETCTEIGWAAYEHCTVCDYTTYVEIPATGHTLTQVDAQAPTCTEVGWDAYEHCTACDYTTYKEIPATGHTYDAYGDCTACDNSVIAMVTDPEGNVTYYATVLAAMQAADGTGATVHVMKSADENWEGAFPDSDPLNNVTITAVDGVTITANSADGEINADAKLCVEDVTFSTGVNFVTKLYMQNFGTVDIYGNVQAYILGIPGGATLNVYGDQEIPATLKVTGSLFMSKASTEGRLNVYGKGDGAVVLNANSSGSKNALCLYAGYLYAKDAVIKCDTLNLEKQGNYVPTVELDNATINITGADSAWTDEYALNIQTEAVFTMTNGSAVDLNDAAATINIIDGETIELSEDSTIITAAATGLQNSKIVVAEGTSGCVWYEDGAYSVKAHDPADATCTEDGLCSNCQALINTATGHSYVDHAAKAPTCTDIGWDAYQTCENCDYSTYAELPANGHAYVDHEAKAPTCTDIGWDAYKTCENCDYTTYVEIPANGHTYVDHEAKAPTCTEIGWNAYQTCENCDYSSYAELPATGHAYDDYGDCTACDNSVIAKVTDLEGNVTYYATFLEALIAANGTGATVKALKNVEEVMQPTFADDLEVLDNVVIDSNPGVTIKDTTPLTWEECPDHAFNMKRVTFTENVNYSQSMILRFLSGETVIIGTVNTYILSLSSVELIINGTLNNTGNVIMGTGHVIINAGGVWNANTNSNNNFVGVYGGTLELNGGTLNCDSLNAIGRILGESESEEGNVERDAAVIIRDGSTLNARQAIGVRKLNLTLEGESTVTLVGEEIDLSTITYDTKYAWVATRKSMEILHQYDLDMTLEADIKLNTFVIDRDMTITLNGYNLTGGPVDLAEGGSLTLVGENNGTLNVTTSLEGKCVWVTAGEGTTIYTTADHVYGDWVEGVKTCSNCGDTLECVHETTSVVTDPTCETAGYTTHSCSVCLHVWTDTEVAALGHSYGDWSDNGDGTHSRTCATDNSHVETADHDHEVVVTEPNCTATGYTTYTCTDCGYSYQDNETETNGVHSYDENGDCIRCGDSVIATVTYLDGTVEYYKTFAEALIAADGTGATVKALKDVAESFQPAFGSEENPLNKVIIDSNPGVTITDTTDIPAAERVNTQFNIRGVTFAENVNFTVDYMILRILGGTNTINGTVKTYILSMNGTTIVNGTLTNTGNVIFSTGKLTINEGGTLAANTNPNIVNFVGLYGGIFEINGGTVTCDNFKAVGRIPSESDSGNVNRDATVIIRDGSTLTARDAFMARKLNLTLEGENSITVVGEEFDASTITYETKHAWLASTKSFIDEANYYKLNYTLMNNIDLTSGSYTGVSFDRDVTVDLNGYTLSGPVDLAEGGSLTVYGENAGTLTVTTALEGKCVWVTTEGTTTTYITAPHVYGDWVNGEKACINCGVTTDCDHIWDSGVVTAPTCEGVGYTTYTCTVCSSKYTDNITAPTGHTYGEWSDSGDGETHKRVCLIDSSHIELVDHTEEAVVTAPTCTADGYTTYTCTVCGSVRTDDIIPATGHTFDRQVITDTYKATDATCIAAATYYYSCSCGEKGDSTFSYGEVDKDAHVNLKQVDAKAPTCEDSGWDAYQYCDICGHTTYVELPATGHSLIQVVGKAPTCTEIGWNAYEYCSACDYTTYEEIAASGHILTQVAAKAPTCTEIGWDAYEYCSACGYTTYAELAATGHDYQAVYTQATNTENAYTTYTCACGDSYVEEEENSMLHCARNERTGETYADVQVALNEAQKGDTIKLIRNAAAADLYVGTQKTLDLNGHELTATVVTAPFATSYIIDSTNGRGLLAVAKDKISLNSTNPQLPLWYDEGARFITVGFGRALDLKDKTGAANENVAYYRFAFTDPAAATLLDDFLANGTEGTGISVRIKATWTNANGIVTQYFTFTSEMVKEYVNFEKGWDNAQFQMYLSGVAGLDISFTAEIVSSANPQATVVIASAAIS